MAARTERKGDLKTNRQSSALAISLANRTRRAEVSVLSHDGGGLIALVVYRPHQIHGETDIHALFLPSGVHSPPIGVDPADT